MGDVCVCECVFACPDESRATADIYRRIARVLLNCICMNSTYFACVRARELGETDAVAHFGVISIAACVPNRNRSRSRIGNETEEVVNRGARENKNTDGFKLTHMHMGLMMRQIYNICFLDPRSGPLNCDQSTIDPRYSVTVLWQSVQYRTLLAPGIRLSTSDQTLRLLLLDVVSK